MHQLVWIPQGGLTVTSYPGGYDNHIQSQGHIK